MRPELVTLLTDFGLTDPYVGAMKGAMLSAAPGVRLVDISHEVPPHDILAGSFLLACAAPWFPEGTVHVAVVDPGVGSHRRAVAVRTARHTYVAPDNGLLTAVLDRDPPHEARVVDPGLLGIHDLPPTFHGRDLFGPVGARLAAGLKMAACGPDAGLLVRAYQPSATNGPDGTIHATVLHVDRFGNVTTNLTPDRLPALVPEPEASTPPDGIRPAPSLSLEPGGPPLVWHASYSFAESGTPFLLWGSSGYLEIAINQRSAATRLTLHPGAPVILYSRT
jgi:S-adenosyl-L-methionine hydrolase (adenosine-forming)